MQTCGLFGRRKYNFMRYEDLIDVINKQKRDLSKYSGITIPNDSWTNDAIKIVNDLIRARNRGVTENEYFSKSKLLYEKSVSSLYQLYDLSKIFSVITSTEKSQLPIISKKINIVCKAPLLMMDENPNTNEGRNTLFELRLFSRFISKGFKPQLSLNHPDILLQINERQYVFECKRPFKINTLVTNVNDAISQLKQYSLVSNNNFGIVAVSITRCIHPGDKRLEVASELIAKTQLQQDMKDIVNRYRSEVFRNFSIRIPALLIEFSDRAVIDKPYSVELLDIIETAQNSFSLFQTIKDDFAKLG